MSRKDTADQVATTSPSRYGSIVFLAVIICAILILGASLVFLSSGRESAADTYRREICEDWNANVTSDYYWDGSICRKVKGEQ